MSVGGSERQAEHLLETYCVQKSCPCQSWSVTAMLLSRGLFPTAVLHADVCGKTLGAWWLGHYCKHWRKWQREVISAGRDTILSKVMEIILGPVGLESLPPSHGSHILLLFQVCGSDMFVLVTYRLSWSSVRKTFGKTVKAFIDLDHKSIWRDWEGFGEVEEE